MNNLKVKNRKVMSTSWKIILVIIVVLFLLSIFVRITRMNDRNIVAPSEDSSIEKIVQPFDYYVPSGGGNSDVLIVAIHGGAWIGGDKSYMMNVAKYFSKKDYSVVNMNYRLIPLSSWFKKPVDVFDQIDDITYLLDYVEGNREDFNLENNYDIVLIGHSAGAHLSAFYGVKEFAWGNHNIDYVVGLAGPYDLNIPGTNPLSDTVREYVVRDFGVEAVSPIDNIYENDQTKYLLVLGSEDVTVPHSQLINFESELNNKGVYVESLYVQGRDHNSIFGQIPYNDVVAKKILEFLEN